MIRLQSGSLAPILHREGGDGAMDRREGSKERFLLAKNARRGGGLTAQGDPPRERRGRKNRPAPFEMTECRSGERGVSLLDWRGFEADDAKAIPWASCWYGGGGGCMRGSGPGAVCGDGIGAGSGCRTGYQLYRRGGAEHGLPDSDAGADCDCVVSVPGVHRGAR